MKLKNILKVLDMMDVSGADIIVNIDGSKECHLFELRLNTVFYELDCDYKLEVLEVTPPQQNDNEFADGFFPKIKVKLTKIFEE